uniref:Synaptopodin n=1 Tax=Peromyscus maniculatus bairdii TaxID=230844 RepID=A0A8C8TIE9_PERMB
MLGPHFPPLPLGPSEGRPAPCTFQIPDGSYRCLALEAEESSSEDGLQGEGRLAELEEEVADRNRVSHGTAQLSRASGVIQPSSCSREARGGFQHSDRASQDWDVVQARKVMTTSGSTSPGPRVAQKPALGRSTSFTEKDLKEAKAWSQQIAAQLTTPPSSNSRGVQLFNRRRQRVNEFTLESRGQRPPKLSQEALPAGHPSSPTGHAPGLSLSPASPSKPGPPKHPSPRSPGRGVPGHIMEEYSEEASLLRHLEKVASEEEEVPLVVYLKENAALLTANGLHLSQSRDPQQPSPNPPSTEVHSPAADINQNPSAPNATVTTAASNSHHNQPTTDVNQNPPATVTPVQQNSSEAQCPPNGTPDSKPGTPCADGQPPVPAEEVRSSILLIDKVSAPSSSATSPFSREATPLSSSGPPPAADLMSSSLLIEMQPSNLVASAEQEMSGRAAVTTPTKVYSEVHLTLAKPASVVNRTARPFGIQAPGSTSQMEYSPMMGRRHFGEKAWAPPAPTMVDRSPQPQRHMMSRSPMVERRLVGQRSPVLERRPLGSFTPPPTYAETLSTAPAASRVRSPPSYSTLYPSSDPKLPHVKSQVALANKTGILEESMARRGSRKSMFTFVEKPKVTPNPDLLDLVQTADEKRRQRDHHGEVGMEEEPFALGAEASNFQQEPAARDRASPAAAEDTVPEWASCLKSPRIQAKPKPKPNQNLSEASGKGAELYARRQSRMEKYVIESSGHAELARCPSPTMSLPSSWKYSTNAPGGFRVASLSPARTPPASLYHGYLPENGVLRPEPTKQQPYQMRPSLYALSPVKEPAKASSRTTSPRTPSRTVSPRAASPAKPSSLDLVPNLPRAGLPPSPALPRHSRSSPGLYTAPIQDSLQPTADRPESLPTSPPWTPGASRPPSSLDGWVSPGPWEPGRGSSTSSPPPLPPPPPPPMSPSWSERSVSPLRPEVDARPPSRQLQALLARNIINAARRKSASPRPAAAETLRPFSPPRGPPPPPPRMRSPQPARPAGTFRGAAFAPIPRSPLPVGPPSCASPRSPQATPSRPFPYRRSPTDSDVSLDSEDSGLKSPGILGYNICPRGWNGSLRLKRGSLPTEASCTT